VMNCWKNCERCCKIIVSMEKDYDFKHCWDQILNYARICDVGKLWRNVKKAHKWDLFLFHLSKVYNQRDRARCLCKV
jgi:hypothetical protein